MQSLQRILPWVVLATKDIAFPSKSRDAVAAASQWHLTALFETVPFHVGSEQSDQAR